MGQGGSGRIKEHGAHIAGLEEVAETVGDGDGAIGQALRAQRRRSDDPARVQGKRESA